MQLAIVLSFIPSHVLSSELERLRKPYGSRECDSYMRIEKKPERNAI